MAPAVTMHNTAFLRSLLLLTNTKPTFLKSLMGPVKNFIRE